MKNSTNKEKQLAFYCEICGKELSDKETARNFEKQTTDDDGFTAYYCTSHMPSNGKIE
jgi:hypothetical protein